MYGLTNSGFPACRRARATLPMIAKAFPSVPISRTTGFWSSSCLAVICVSLPMSTLPSVLPLGVRSHLMPPGRRCRNITESIGGTNGIEVADYAHFPRISLDHPEGPMPEILGDTHFVETHLGGKIACRVPKNVRRALAGPASHRFEMCKSLLDGTASHRLRPVARREEDIGVFGPAAVPPGSLPQFREFPLEIAAKHTLARHRYRRGTSAVRLADRDLEVRLPILHVADIGPSQPECITNPQTGVQQNQE